MATYVPPRDGYELQVALAIGRACAREDVGALDDLGLEPDVASPVAREIETLLGRAVCARTVRDCDTVEQLACACRMSPKSGPWSPLVTVRAASVHGVPLTFVHPIGGNAFWYLNLCRKLPATQATFALHARGLDLDETPHTSIAEMAHAYVDALQATHPRGPYALAGWSFGGFVAFEMAQQLAARSQPVQLLVVFDVGPEDGTQIPPTATAAAGLLLHALRLDRDAVELIAMPERARTQAMLERARRRRTIPPDFTVAHLERMLELNLLHLAAMSRYAPASTAVDMLVLSSAARDERGDSPANGALGWRDVTRGSVSVARLAGTHFDALDRVHHELIAEEILTRLVTMTTPARV